jgi:hypothetical protein
MPVQIAVIVVVVVLVVVVGAYMLGTYLRRRQDDLPPEAPPRPARTSTPTVSSTSTSARKPVMIVPPGNHEVRVVVNWLLTQAFEQTGIRVADDKLAYDRIVSAAQRAVDDLKREPAVDISLPFLTADASGPKHLESRLTREMIAELVKY